LAQATINFGGGAGFVQNQLGFAGVRDLAEDAVKFRIEHGQVYETITPPIYYGLLSNTLGPPKYPDAKEEKPAEKPAKEKSLSDSAVFFYPYDVPDQAKIREDLKMRAAETPAQLRVWVNRLAGTNIAKIAQAHGYLRARRASAGNARFLQVLSEQLHVEPKDALKVAEDILGAEPVCRMGGRYELTQDERGYLSWQSTAWKEPSYHSIDAIPDSFIAPLIEGFHEASLDFNINETTLSSHLVLEVNAAKE
jgi:hypothetical protein